jgi:hypothetical protein
MTRDLCKPLRPKTIRADKLLRRESHWDRCARIPRACRPLSGAPQRRVRLRSNIYQPRGAGAAVIGAGHRASAAQLETRPGLIPEHILRRDPAPTRAIEFRLGGLGVKPTHVRFLVILSRSRNNSNTAAPRSRARHRRRSRPRIARGPRPPSQTSPRFSSGPGHGWRNGARRRWLC